MFPCRVFPCCLPPCCMFLATFFPAPCLSYCMLSCCRISYIDCIHLSCLPRYSPAAHGLTAKRGSLKNAEGRSGEVLLLHYFVNTSSVRNASNLKLLLQSYHSHSRDIISKLCHVSGVLVLRGHSLGDYQSQDLSGNTQSNSSRFCDLWGSGELHHDSTSADSYTSTIDLCCNRATVYSHRGYRRCKINPPPKKHRTTSALFPRCNNLPKREECTDYATPPPCTIPPGAGPTETLTLQLRSS